MKKLLLILSIFPATLFSQQNVSCLPPHDGPIEVYPAPHTAPARYNWNRAADDIPFFSTDRWAPDHTQAMNSRSDTFDILHYTIKLSIIDFSTDTIRGNTTIHLTPLINNQASIDLDLLHMHIDSVVMNNASLTWTYTDTLMRVTFATPMNIGDTSDLIVYYHGRPQMDPSGWGGFYFSGGYAFNLGVGFQTNPVNFGRAWFPCFDNFVERSTYTFVIGTNGGKIAYCNGILGADTTDMNGVRWRTWDIQERIVTYLACVAVANYTQVNWSHTGIYGTYPVILTALAADTTNFKASCLHLQNALDIFEDRYGPYRWSHVGYVLVPFSNGAMEHATNIAFPKICANGSVTYEANIMAHELSHHWFGDPTTCRTESDMWLNEGWASYSEHIFTEGVYGRAAYDAAILANHSDMVQYVHHREGGFLTENQVPHQYTYGDHVYLKGADLAHTLRGYMGDSLFFSSLHYYLTQRHDTDVSSYDFRDALVASSGLTCVNDYFNDWIFNPGWPHFSIDSTVVVPNGPDYDVTVYVRQKLFGAPNYFTNVPLEFSFLDGNWQETTTRQIISGPYTNFTVTLPFDPVMTAVDMHDLIGDAEADQMKTITANGTYTLTQAKMTLTVDSLNDSLFIRIEHNFVKPDSIKDPALAATTQLSVQRYWNVDGIFPSTPYHIKSKMYYDGRTTGTTGGGFWLDNDLTVPNGDSIILMYRRDASDDWHEWPYYTKFIIGLQSTSKYGYMTVDSLAKGQYAFAKGPSSVLQGVTEVTAPAAEILAYPNPAFHDLTVEWPGASQSESVHIEIYDLDGKLVHSEDVHADRKQVHIENWQGGNYIIRVTQNGKELGRKQVVIIH